MDLKKSWHALDLDIEAPATEAVEYGLMEAGALGTETADGRDELIKVTAYFTGVPNRERVRQELFDALRIYELPSSSVRDMQLREVPETDWLGEWKRSWQPVEVGRFIVAPSWTEIRLTPDRLVVRIEPGMAFGTGTHETTRLCLQALEKHFVGDSFLDVGTGTGILAIAAAKIRPTARIIAVDTDPQAIVVACENAALNGVAEQIQLSVGTVDNTTTSADFVCANLTADVIVQILPQLIGATCGRLVLSGILIDQIDLVRARLVECGLDSEPEIWEDGEWAAIIV